MRAVIVIESGTPLRVKLRGARGGEYNMIKKFVSSVASVSLVMSLMAPVAYADDLLISGNGDSSTNVINNTDTTNITVEQSTKTGANVTVSASANTGGNSADSNTGDGGVTVDTGNATTTVITTITGGSNEATLPSCGCQSDPTTGEISGNGHLSTNVINNTESKVASVKQKAKTKAKVKVKKAKAKTGNNSADANTGSGEVEVKTGNAETTVDTLVEGGSNTLNP